MAVVIDFMGGVVVVVDDVAVTVVVVFDAVVLNDVELAFDVAEASREAVAVSVVVVRVAKIGPPRWPAIAVGDRR